MSSRTLFILAVIAAGTVLLAVKQSQRSEGSAPVNTPTYLIQGLEPETIAAIEISAADSEDTIRLTRQGKRFLVTNKSNYPAANKQVTDLFTKCLDIKTLQLYSSNPANHEDLEVTEKTAQHVIKFLDGEGAVITGLIVGKSREQGQGQYARQVGQNEVYLVDRIPWFQTSATNYLNQEIASLKTEKIQSISITSPNGVSELITSDPNDGGDKYQFVNLPEGKRLKKDVAGRVFSALSSIRFDDVFKEAPEGLTLDSSLTCTLESGLIYTFKIGKLDDKSYLTCKADYTGEKSIQLNTSQADSEEELKKKEAILMANKTALEFTERNKGWVYQIPKWKVDALLKSPDDLLEDIPTPQPTTTNVMDQVIDANATPSIGPTLPDSN